MNEAGAGRFNAAQDLIDRNLTGGRAERTAYVDDDGRYSYRDLATRVQQFAGALHRERIRPEERVVLCLEDSIDFPVAFLGALWAGVIPIPVNTQLTTADYAHMVAHSRARAVFVSPAQEAAVAAAVRPPAMLVGSIAQFTAGAAAAREPYDSCADDAAFWLYSSGSTGAPKGAVHAHGSLRFTAEHYAHAVLGITGSDVVYSASKLFFAYGLGNALTFPLSVGATAVLTRQRVTAEVAFDRICRHRATLFFGVPTLFANMLARPGAPDADRWAVRLAVSAGEGLPREIGEQWRARFGSDILDGIGSTEMLHIFISNRPGDVRYGTTGRPVPGYEVRISDDAGREVAEGQLGDLYVKGDSSAMMYWADRRRSRETFQGEWTRTGDKYLRDGDGCYVYGGRSDDMLKVGGLWVSPFEVESALMSHPDVLEAAVVGAPDAAGLIKPKAFVVLRGDSEAGDPAVLRDALCRHVKARLAHYKAPHWVEFVTALPRTATGKVQRFRLRI